MFPNLHRQIPCKVRVYVDEHIRELVEVLNTFDKVSTCDSCEGGEGRQAFVCLGYGVDGLTSSDEICKFLCDVIKSFKRHIDSIDCAGYRTHVSLNWRGSMETPSIWIEMPPDCVKEVTNIFACVRRDLENGNVDKQ